MKLSDADILRLLPQFMRSDDAVKGLSAGTNEVTKDLVSKIRLLSTWNRIDSMTHEELDELAWELNIEWYEDSATIETKRRLIKESDIVHSTLGTKYAVESVVSAYFGDGIVQEWFEYGGQPHYFKVLSSNANITNEEIDKFMHILEIVKRKSSWLDGIVITISGETRFFVGMAYHESTHETVYIGPPGGVL